jgi:hypothetical protein
MAKNNPNPNKFKVSPWLVYAILLIFLFISFVAELAKAVTSSKFNGYLENKIKKFTTKQRPKFSPPETKNN